MAWANGYSRKCLLTYNVRPASACADFPNLVIGTYPELADVAHGGCVNNTVTLNGQTVPADLIFTSDSDGSTLLSWEIVSWTNTSGAIVAWVKFSRSSSADDVIYVWVGKSSVTTYQCTATDVWSANYAGVWHLPDGSVLSLLDSTSNGKTGALRGGKPAPGVIAGKLLDGGMSFSGGGNGQWVITSPAKTFTNYTVSMWLNLASKDYYKGLWSMDGYTPGAVFGGGDLLFRSGSSYVWPATDHTLNTWEYYTFVQSGANVQMYRNGTAITGGGGTFGAAATPTNFYIGWWNYNSLEGGIDEVRLSDSVRSADWIALEYAQQNQASPGYSAGTWDEPAGGLFLPSLMHGLGAGGPFFRNPLG